MPLTWDYTEAPDFEAIPSHLRQTAPFMCISVGIGHITEDNVEDFYRRVHMMEACTGAFRTGVDSDTDKVESVALTPDEARSLVGMRCNVTPMTKAKFKGHLFKVTERMVKF